MTIRPHSPLLESEPNCSPWLPDAVDLAADRPDQLSAKPVPTPNAKSGDAS